MAKWIHWITALCFLVAYCSVYYSHWFLEYRSPSYRAALVYHYMFGMTVLMLFVPRIIWRFINVEPEPDPAPHWQHLAAKAAHWALYFIILSLPITGWLGTGGRTVNMFWLFEIPIFRGTELFTWLVEGKMGMTFEEWEKPVDTYHKYIAGRWAAWILIVIHAGAAFYHHYVQKDNTLRRMLPFGKIN